MHLNFCTLFVESEELQSSLTAKLLTFALLQRRLLNDLSSPHGLRASTVDADNNIIDLSDDDAKRRLTHFSIRSFAILLCDNLIVIIANVVLLYYQRPQVNHRPCCVMVLPFSYSRL